MRRFFSLIALVSCLLLQGQSNISIFRNDGNFNQIKLTEGKQITHSVASGQLHAEVNDWLFGQTAVPLSTIDTCIVKAGDIPVLRFTLPDYPDSTALWDKENYISANLSIEGNGYTDDISELSLQLRGRGNSTWGMPKKPMRLKLAKKTSICGLRKAKNFVLLNNYLDPTLMRNALAMWLARRLGVPYANSMIPCHVFINDRYAGAYTLTEKVGINSASVDIDENEGMLFELSIEYDEKYKFRSAVWNYPVMVKDPDFDELFEENPEGSTPEERLKLWEADFNQAEQLVKAGNGAEVFDIESAVNYTLLYLMVSNNEIGFPRSLYIHKKSLDEGEKYFFGPAWDFDVAFNFLSPSEDGYICRPANESYWIPEILEYLATTPEFKAVCTEKLKEINDEIFAEWLEYFDNYADLITASAKYDGLRWPTTGIYMGWAYKFSSFDFRNQAALLRKWLEERKSYLDKLPIIAN